MPSEVCLTTKGGRESCTPRGSDDEAPQDEREDLEAKLVDNATASATIEELEIKREALGGKLYDLLGRLFDQTAATFDLAALQKHGGVPV